MMLAYKNNTHIPGISTHYFPKDVAIQRKWTRFDRDVEEILHFNFVSLMLLTGSEDACYEHTPLALVNSGEDKQ